jgi:pilus assembly protein CpaF
LTSAYDALLAKLHGIIAARDLNVAVDGVEVRRIAETETERFQRETTIGTARFEAFSDPGDVVARLVRDVEGVGAEMEELIADGDVEEIYGTDGDLTYRTTTGETIAVSTPVSPTAVLRTIQRLVVTAGEQLDASHPRADGIRVFLPGGRQGRLTASIPPRVDGTVSFTLRLPQKRHTTLDDLVGFGSLTPAAAQFLAVLMLVPRLKLLVVGPPGSGKTTLIEACLRAVSPRRRTIVAEENRELSAPLLNGEYWATSKVEDLTDLIRSARVASPALIVLGELKGAEAWDLILAGNLGTGVIAAVHADSAALGFDALATAASLAVPTMGSERLREQFARIFDVVVFVDLDDSDGDKTVRQITEISVVPPQLSTAAVAVTPIFARTDIGEDMELRSADLGPLLERKCNRILRSARATIGDVLNGHDVNL